MQVNETECEIYLIDALNPRVGYSVRITRIGETILFTSKRPDDGTDIITFKDALEVAAMYT